MAKCINESSSGIGVAINQAYRKQRENSEMSGIEHGNSGVAG